MYWCDIQYADIVSGGYAAALQQDELLNNPWGNAAAGPAIADPVAPPELGGRNYVPFPALNIMREGLEALPPANLLEEQDAMRPRLRDPENNLVPQVFNHQEQMVLAERHRHIQERHEVLRRGIPNHVFMPQPHIAYPVPRQLAGIQGRVDGLLAQARVLPGPQPLDLQQRHNGLAPAPPVVRSNAYVERLPALRSQLRRIQAERQREAREEHRGAR